MQCLKSYHAKRVILFALFAMSLLAFFAGYFWAIVPALIFWNEFDKN